MAVQCLGQVLAFDAPKTGVIVQATLRAAQHCTKKGTASCACRNTNDYRWSLLFLAVENNRDECLVQGRYLVHEFVGIPFSDRAMVPCMLPVRRVGGQTGRNTIAGKGVRGRPAPG